MTREVLGNGGVLAPRGTTVRVRASSATGLPPVRQTTACGIRELTEEGKQPLVVGMLLSRLLGTTIPKAERPKLLVLNLVRLVDYAIREHAAARRCLQRHVESGEPTDLFDCLGHLEACIGGTRRAFRCLGRLKRYRDFRLDRSLRRLAERYALSVQQARNTVEHMDDEIHGGKLDGGKRPWPVLSDAGDRLTIGRHTILFADLASALRGLWRIAERVSDVRHDPRVRVLG